jgi:hypothetical protein
MNDVFGWWTHESDWEHITVRITKDGSAVLGIFVQAHGSNDTYSTWYYPPGTHDASSCYQLDSDRRIVIYSADTGHASYTSGGSHAYTLIRGSDTTEQGVEWATWNNLVLLDFTNPDHAWLRYSGRWGVGSWQANAPQTPSFQGTNFPGWLGGRADGPSTQPTNVVVSLDAAKGQDSRVSANFTLAYQPTWQVEWKIAGVPDTSQIPGVTFNVNENIRYHTGHSGDDKTRQSNVTDGTITSAVLPCRNPSRLYIAGLQYKDPHTGSVSQGADAIKALNVTSFTVSIAPTDPR